MAALQQIRQAVTASQTFEPLLSDRTFTIDSSDYTSFVLMPPLLKFSLKKAPFINIQMIEFEKDRIGNLLE